MFKKKLLQLHQKKRLILFFLSLFMVSFSFAQQVIIVKGIILSEKNIPLAGVTVLVKGSTSTATTDEKGMYLIKASKGATLVYSLVGYEEKEIKIINENTAGNVILVAKNENLDEVVVVGYGTQKKTSVVAAIGTITSAEIVRTASGNLTVGLAGKLPGLTIMQKDGQLGKESLQTFIRGQATLNSSAPLIMVDGVERELYSLSAYDVESISILKDASATAVYGVRGANGVIIVTTKKGISGKTQVTANTSYTTQALTFLPTPVNANDFMALRNQVVRMNDSTATLPFTPEILQHYKDGDLPEYYVDRNWYKEFMNNYTPMQTNQVNIRGGNETTKFFASVGYMHQGGPFKTERNPEYNYDNAQYLNRFTYRANLDMKITKNLKAWVNLAGYLQDKNDPMLFSAGSNGTTGDYYYLLLANMLDLPSIVGADNTPNGNDLRGEQAPYAMLNRGGFRITTTNSINSTVGFEHKLNFLTDGLSARVVASYDPMATHIRGYKRTFSTYNAILSKTPAGKDTVTYILGSGRQETGLSSVLYQSLSLNYDLQASLNYNNAFRKHAVTGMLLYNKNQRTIDAQVPFNYIGLVGRLTYDYDSRYLGEVNFGYNGSEQFAPGKRFGFFPSFSAGWVISEEDFMKSSKAIQLLKIRASYGKVGNDKISGSRFLYLDDWTQGTGGYFNGITAIPGLPTFVYQNSIPNTNVGWEVANKYNFGFESKFLKGFGFDFDLFYEKRNSILITRSLLPVYMFGQLNLPPTNNGVMENKGFEATLSYQKKVNKDFFFRTTFSTAYARNKVLKANEVPFDSTYAYRNQIEGYPVGMVFGYKNLGYFKDQADIDASPSHAGLGSVVLPGDLKYADLNKDGKIDVKDLMPMKYPLVPELSFSFNINAEYKGFDMSIMLQGVTNYNYDFRGRAIFDYSGNSVNVINNISVKNYYTPNLYAWTPDKVANGGDIRYPRIHSDGNTVSKQISDYWEINLWYMRVKNVELGYTLPKQLSSRIGMSDLRFYFNALNMFTFSNMPFKILDPEVSNSLNHPIYKNFNLGVNVSF